MELALVLIQCLVKHRIEKRKKGKLHVKIRVKQVVHRFMINSLNSIIYVHIFYETETAV